MADYAKRKCARKHQQVTELLVERCNLEKQQQEKDLQYGKMMHRLERTLVASNASSSRVTQSLKGRVTRLSTALENEKEKAKQTRKESKITKAEHVDEMKAAEKIQERDIKCLKATLRNEKDVAVKLVRGQGMKRATLLRERHCLELSRIHTTHNIAMYKLKAKAKSQVDKVRFQG